VHGYDPGPADGLKGRRTTDAIKAFQRDKSLMVDGFAGPNTVAALGIKVSSVKLVKGTGKGIKNIVVHCTATREGMDVDAATIRGWHLSQGWSDIGYHFIARLSGEFEIGRSESVPGSHVKGFNTGSIGVVYVGGLDAQGNPKDTRTLEQKASMIRLLTELTQAYPGAVVKGHRDFSPDKNRNGIIEPH